MTQPTEDSDKCRRLRGHLALMVDAAEARLKGMHAVKEKEIMCKVGSALQGIQEALKDIENDFAGRDHATTRIIDNLLTEMSMGFSTLSLTLEQ